MAELGKLDAWRHAAAGVAVLACSGLALFGIIGEDKGDERFEAKQVTVTPTGDDGLTIREVVDQDFGGSRDSHGYQRFIPNDFGEPTDVTATSPDAPADVSVTPVGGETRIRVGDPDQTVSGQHRYVLTYTLPDARLSSGELALDVIGNDETLETGRFEVVVTGLQLDDPLCNVGGFGTSGGCTLEPDGAVYRAVVSPLEPGDGITIGGTINGRTDAVAVPEPGLPARRGDNRIPMALAVLAVGTAGASGTYLWARRRGRNEVFAGGAADAAFGAPPTGLAHCPRRRPGAAVSLVADERMDDLATTEFVPPQGLEPWQGTVLLRERIDNESVGAWFSGLAARDVITLTRTDDDEVTLGVGEQFETAAPEDREVLSAMFDGRREIELGSYDKRFAIAWRDVRSELESSIARSGWWKRHAPHVSSRLNVPWPAFLVLGMWVLIVFGGFGLAQLRWISSPPGALAFGFVVPVLAAYAVYRTLLPVRSATGSAFALRAESFRRFLKASEGRHVEWAWKQGLLREYSAWAVALGAADAWERAMHASSVAPVELAQRPAAHLHDGAVVESHVHRARRAPVGAAASGAEVDSAAAASAAASPAAASVGAAAAAAPAPGNHPEDIRVFPAHRVRGAGLSLHETLGWRKTLDTDCGDVEPARWGARVLRVGVGARARDPGRTSPRALRRRLDRDLHRDHRRRPRRDRHRRLARRRAGRPVRAPAAPPRAR